MSFKLVAYSVMRMQAEIFGHIFESRRQYICRSQQLSYVKMTYGGVTGTQSSVAGTHVCQ